MMKSRNGTIMNYARFNDEQNIKDQLMEKAETLIEWSESQMKERPLTVILASLAIGVVAGWVIKWR